MSEKARTDGTYQLLNDLVFEGSADEIVAVLRHIADEIEEGKDEGSTVLGAWVLQELDIDRETIEASRLGL